MKETTHRVWLQGCWEMTSLHWFLMSGLAFSNGEGIVTAGETWYSVLLLLGLLRYCCSSLSVYSNSEVNSWGHKKGLLEGSKPPTLNTRVCFSKQEHPAFWLPYWLFFRQLSTVCGKGLGLRVWQAVRLCSWKCHFSFHSYQFTGYAFFGTFTLSEFLMGAVIKVFSEW